MIKNVSAAVVLPAGLRSRLGTGFAFSVVAAIFNSGSTFLVNIVVANLLGRETYGEFAIVQNTLLTLANVASLGTGFTATKYVAEFRLTDREKTERILGLCSALSFLTGGFFTALLFLGAPWLAQTVLKAPGLSTGLMVAAVVVFFNVKNFYQTGVLAGLEAYSAIAKTGVIAGTTYFVLCASGASHWGRDGAIAGLAASAGVQWLALRFFLQRECIRQSLKVDYRRLGEERDIFLKFSIPAALSGFSTMPALWFANTLLIGQAGGYVQMGLYAAANNLRVLVLFLPQLLNSVGTSLINNARGLGNQEHYRKMFWSNLGLTFVMTSAAAVGAAFFGPTLLSLFGKSFGEGYPVLLVLMASTLLEGLTLAVYQVIQSHAKMWLSLFAVALPRDSTIVLLAFLLTPIYGATGLALAYTIGWGLALVSTVFVAWWIDRRVQNWSTTFG